MMMTATRQEPVMATMMQNQLSQVCTELIDCWPQPIFTCRPMIATCTEIFHNNFEWANSQGAYSDGQSMQFGYFTFASSAILVAAVLFTDHWGRCYETPTLAESAAKTKSKSVSDLETATASEKAEILRQYFELEGISADLDSDSFVGRYGTEILGKMSEMWDIRNDLVGAFNLNCEINTMLYNSALSSPQSTLHQDIHLSPPDAALLEALDLMVPNSKTQPVYALAKRDLTQFCVDKPNLCEELLQRLRGPLADHLVYTMRVMLYLESLYYNWIPLARLTDHLESSASRGSGS